MRTPDQWLSAFFGRKIVQAKVRADDFAQIERLQQQGFALVEGELHFAWRFANFSPKTTACQPATVADLAELQALFGSAFPNSRFRPPYFSVAENRRFYQNWAAKAVRGEFDDLCLMKRNEQGRLQGGITLRLASNRQASVGLLAVNPAFQRQGVAGELLNAAATWAASQNAECLKIATQSSNAAAIRLYQQWGAELEAVYYWFYPADGRQNDDQR